MRATADLRPAPDLTLIWLGRGEATRLEGGQWKRSPEFDYEFSVVQRRYGERWESVKELHRRHPGYDGSAGPRDQTYTFEIAWAPPTAEGVVRGKIWSTLGDGSLDTDREFRRGKIEIAADISSMAPFDTYRITQDYQYEQGRLVELVELVKKGTGGPEKEWVRNQEHAELFGARQFEAPPTRR